MQTSSKNNSFQTWLANLENGITNLSRDVPTGDPEKLSKQAETYESEIQLLYVHAKLHQIDTGRYQAQFSRIDAHLKHVKTAIEVRKNGRFYQAYGVYKQVYSYYATPVQNSETPRWRKALGFILGAISFLANLMSLTPLLNYLPLPWNGPKLLR